MDNYASGTEYPAVTGERKGKLSTKRRKLYCQYLLTSALVRSIEHGERELSTARQQGDKGLVAVWTGVLEDFRYELSCRQLTLPLSRLRDDVGE